jgi:tRNA-dihydrouridine synthase
MRHLPLFRRWTMRLTWPLLALLCNLLWRPREGFNLRYAAAFKARLRIPVICVGGFRSRGAMEDALDRGLCDIVAAGRAFIADPLLYRHLRDAVPGPVCVDCNACVGHLGSLPLDCYHPRVGGEKRAMIAALAAR